MPTLYDAAYALALAAATPVLAYKPKLREKVRSALKTRDGRVPARRGNEPLVVIHGVSVGEINAARPLVAALAPHARVAVAATTETGYARALELFTDDIDAPVFATRYPVDTSAAVGRFLDALRPTMVVAMELELWPNLIKLAEKRGIPVVVANGRITTSSFAAYRRLGPLARPMFRGTTAVLAQDETYADRFRQLGVPGDRVSVVGSLKFDAAPESDHVEGAESFAASLGLHPRQFGGTERVIVAGSTGPGEESMVLDTFERVTREDQQVRLVLVPRHPPRFDEVADLIRRRRSLTRRSTGDVVDGGVVLVDTMGELRLAWSLADVAIVGRTLVDLGPRQHGSDLLEPAALGKPIITGPFYGNFDAPTRALLEAGGATLVTDPNGLHAAVAALLADGEAAQSSGNKAKQVVHEHRGATQHTLRRLLPLLR